eukprot:1193270-Prorocentrum_minimum.AAC.2
MWGSDEPTLLVLMFHQIALRDPDAVDVSTEGARTKAQNVSDSVALIVSTTYALQRNRTNGPSRFGQRVGKHRGRKLHVANR